MPTPLTLLLVDDDPAFSAALAAELGGFGHAVTQVGDDAAAAIALDHDQYDAVILDWAPPRLDGIAMLRRMRAAGFTLPVVMFSARGRPVDRIEGLETGADDYVVKPAGAAELNARLQALLRGRRWSLGGSDTLRAGDIVVSPARFRAWRAGRAIDLGNLEFRLLAELARNADAVVTRAMLLERVWRADAVPATNIVDAYIRRLRVKLNADGGADPIVTVRGVGYMLRG